MPAIVQLLLSLLGGVGAARASHALLSRAAASASPRLAGWLMPELGKMKLIPGLTEGASFMAGDTLVRNLLDASRVWEQPPINAPAENNGSKLDAYRLQSQQEQTLDELLRGVF